LRPGGGRSLPPRPTPRAKVQNRAAAPVPAVGKPAQSAARPPKPTAPAVPEPRLSASTTSGRDRGAGQEQASTAQAARPAPHGQTKRAEAIGAVNLARKPAGALVAKSGPGRPKPVQEVPAGPTPDARRAQDAQEEAPALETGEPALLADGELAALEAEEAELAVLEAEEAELAALEANEAELAALEANEAALTAPQVGGAEREAEGFKQEDAAQDAKALAPGGTPEPTGHEPGSIPAAALAPAVASAPSVRLALGGVALSFPPVPAEGTRPAATGDVPPVSAEPPAVAAPAATEDLPRAPVKAEVTRPAQAEPAARAPDALLPKAGRSHARSLAIVAAFVLVGAGAVVASKTLWPSGEPVPEPSAGAATTSAAARPTSSAMSTTSGTAGPAAQAVDAGAAATGEPDAAVAPSDAGAPAADAAAAGPAADAGSGGDGSELLSYEGYIIVHSSVNAEVFVQGVDLGPTNTKLKSRCYQKFVRLAKMPGQQWLNQGTGVRIACRAVTEVSLEPDPGVAP
jgi:hypothetical protein